MEDIFQEMISKLTSVPVVQRKDDEDLLHRYKGIPYIRTFPMEALKAMETFEVRSDDVFLITYPKAGTTWTQEIVSMVMSGADEEELSKTHLYFRFPFIEMNWASHYSQCDKIPSVYTFLDKVASPRTIKTHLSKDHLPPQLYTKKPKIIYIARNPKDVAASYFNMHKHFNIMPYYSTFDKFLSDYMEGDVHCGSWYGHTLYWWKKRHEPNVLFLKYEDMKKCDKIPSVYTFLDKVASPRTIKTHLSKDHLPPQLYTKKPKIIYIARNPKDVAASYFNMHKHFNIMPYYSTFDKFLSDYMEGDVHCGSWYGHTLYWWKKRHEPNVLFLKYEDMKKDLGKVVKQIANLLDCEMSEEAVELTVRHCSFQSMKENRNTNPDYLEFFTTENEENKPVDPNASFIRKGTVGDWKNYFSVAQNEAFDAEYIAKMQGTGLDFDFVID